MNRRYGWRPFALIVLTFLSGPLRGLDLLRADGPDTAGHFSEPAINASDRDYWAYQPVVRPDVPQIESDAWSHNPIDKFVLHQLRRRNSTADVPLKPAAAADAASLLRRITFDLTGLPPTPVAITRFLQDPSPAACEQVVEELLDDPAYGERWAQHWLDLVRFAETDGFEHDKVRPQAWRYRDWVIEALNNDLPYDQFLTLQLAGDEVAPDSPAALVATGYLMAGPDMPDINLQEERRHNFLNGMTGNFGSVYLGLRLGCAQCHHHRTDPISQHDFYRLRACFETIDLFRESPLPGGQTKARIVRNVAGPAPENHLWIRGDFRRRGPRVAPQPPRIFSRLAHGQETFTPSAAGRRTQLAEWLTRRDHPLTARVIVNRLWQHHFGVGLIPTASDFGWMGEAASHQQLFDWLAAELMESGWRLKPLHRLILTSATYQLASRPSPQPTTEELELWTQLENADPDNRWLARGRRRRLEAEAIRDAMLAVSGELNRKQGGPGVFAPLPDAVASTLLENQWPVTENEAEHARRSIYMFARRNLRAPLLEAFDKPDSNLSCPRRSATTIAPQALHLLNSEFALKRANRFAARIEQSSDHNDVRIEQAYLVALGRLPMAHETTACMQFLSGTDATESKWPALCHALLNLNEFVYVD